MIRKREKQPPTRLLNRDGQLNIHKDTFNSFRVYNHIMNISWQRFLGYALASFIFFNLLFTLFYLMAGGINCLNNATNTHFFNEFLEIYFFSTQTFTTVGYGHVHPSCLAGNLIASFESFIGWIFFSVVTGLFYAKFTEPHVEIRLSEVAVLDYFKEGLGLKFIIANEYDNKLVDVEVTLDLIKLEIIEGQHKKRFYQLFLYRKSIPFLSLPWTVVHSIDKNSPLYGMTKEDFEKGQLEFFVQIKAFDEAHRQVLFREFSYFGSEEVLWGYKFVNIQRYTETGALKLKMNRFGKSIKIEDFPEKLDL
jgi:inward rectifier potassium channel